MQNDENQTPQEKAFKLLEDLYLLDHSFEKHIEFLHELFIGFARNNSERELLNKEHFEDAVFFYTEIRRLLQGADQIFRETQQE